jgi:hypothetical protein
VRAVRGCFVEAEVDDRNRGSDGRARSRTSPEGIEADNQWQWQTTAVNRRVCGNLQVNSCQTRLEGRSGKRKSGEAVDKANASSQLMLNGGARRARDGIDKGSDLSGEESSSFSHGTMSSNERRSHQGRTGLGVDRLRKRKAMPLWSRSRVQDAERSQSQRPHKTRPPEANAEMLMRQLLSGRPSSRPIGPDIQLPRPFARLWLSVLVALSCCS